MDKLRKWVALTLIFTLIMTTIHGQPTYIQDDNAYSCAYMQSSQAAHWSAYVPIGIMVAAAIWFGIADQKHEHDSDATYSYKTRRYYTPSTTTTATSGHY